MRLCLITSIVAAFASLAAADDKPPHIVFMMADDLGWQDVGYNGGRVIKTPSIDALAARGTRLGQFYVQPVCSPTRAALMTGRYPMRTGLQCGVVRPWARHGLPLDEVLLPQLLRRAGYKTAICGKWHLGHLSADYLPTRRGFDHQFGHYNGALDYFTHIRDGGLDWHRNDKVLRQEGYTTDLIAAEAAEILAKHDTGQPLFLYVPFNAPHTPLQAPDETIEKYAAVNNKSRRVYAAMVDRMDTGVGKILAALDRGDYENTLIVFCSDNGGIPRLGSNGPLRAGKGTLYEGGVRVPCIVDLPGEAGRGGTNQMPMHIVDMLPTLVGFAGGELPKANLDGFDMRRPLLDGKQNRRQEMLLNVTPFHGALRVGDWKIVHNGHVTANVTSASPKEKWELFNLADDPSERTDLRERKPEKFRQLKARLGVLAAEAVKPNIPPNRPPADFVVPKVWGEF